MKSFRLIIPFLFIFISSCMAKPADNSSLSGMIEDGLRILSVDEGSTELDFTIYRGDYIVFDFEKAGSYNFTVPSLEIDTIIPKSETEKPYVKMKESGEYSFTLGEREGIIRVLELVEPHYRELTAAEASNLLANTDPVIIDVRTPGEFENAHIAGAELLPVQVLADNLDKIMQYKDEDILLYCQSGNRSTVAAKILIDSGFTNISNLRYGIGDWIRKGNPVE